MISQEGAGLRQHSHSSLCLAGKGAVLVSWECPRVPSKARGAAEGHGEQDATHS